MTTGERKEQMSSPRALQGDNCEGSHHVTLRVDLVDGCAHFLATIKQVYRGFNCENEEPEEVINFFGFTLKKEGCVLFLAGRSITD